MPVTEACTVDHRAWVAGGRAGERRRRRRDQPPAAHDRTTTTPVPSPEPLPADADAGPSNAAARLRRGEMGTRTSPAEDGATTALAVRSGAEAVLQHAIRRQVLRLEAVTTPGFPGPGVRSGPGPPCRRAECGD